MSEKFRGDLAGRLGEVDEHSSVERVVSVGEVPNIVTVHSIGVVVYQHIPADTCIIIVITNIISISVTQNVKRLVYNKPNIKAINLK